MGSMLLLAGCIDTEDPYNPDPCAASYDGNAFIARIAQEYELSTWSVSPRNYRAKMPMDPDTVDCGTIQASVGFHGVRPVDRDSFALSVARLFFEDPKNASVHKLDLELVSILDGIGRVQAHYLLGREHARRTEEAPPVPSADAVRCNVVSEHPLTISMGDEQRKGLALSALADHGARDMAALARAIKVQYDARIQQEGISELTIDIRVEQRSCTLCDEVLHSFFYVRENRNL